MVYHEACFQEASAMLTSSVLIPLTAAERQLYEEIVPESHFLRRLHVIDFEAFRSILESAYTGFGRPPLDSVFLLKVELLARQYRFSDREVIAAVQFNVAFRLFLGISLKSPLPHHSLLTYFRQRLGTERLQQVFDNFRTPDMGSSRSERFVGLDGQPELEVRAREARGQCVDAFAQSGQGLRPVRRRLRRNCHAEFVGSYLQAAARLKGGLQQGSAFVLRAGVMLLKHSQQLRLDLIGNYLERIHEQTFFFLQRSQVAGRDSPGQLPQLLFQPLHTGLCSLQLSPQFAMRDLEPTHRC